MTRATRGAVDMYRIVVGAVMLGLLVLTLSWLQSRFDSSDHEKATTIVRNYKPQGAAIDLTALILRKHPDQQKHDISWRSEIRSGCFGHVRVSAYVPAKGSAAATTYAFDVDLPAMSIHPTDPMTKGVLEELATITSTATGSR